MVNQNILYCLQGMLCSHGNYQRDDFFGLTLLLSEQISKISICFVEKYAINALNGSQVDAIRSISDKLASYRAPKASRDCPLGSINLNTNFSVIYSEVAKF